ncbi:MAG: hypothetical protein HC851_18765 [Acaryochloris sp. RU_4_1]|nr:hypothetical protein [Acaryochloris sp. RU_4_1]NJR57022.1 hypothetical protein [Acaryochloris sp. CRU_2_0]
MQNFATKTDAITYARGFGWNKVDGERAFKDLNLPTDEVTLLNAMVRFAGPELKHRQHLQGAQKGQVTLKKKELEAIEKQYEQMVQSYENQIRCDRSDFTMIIKTCYGIAQKFGYKDPWIESLIVAYDQYVKGGHKAA